MMFLKRLALLLPWRRRAAERDMQDELTSIAAMARPGELGNLTLAAEDARAQWGWTRLEQTGQDLRYAFRTLRKSPAFTATAVLSLALGIGANTALFTLMNTVMWKLLPVSDPEQLLVLGQQDEDGTSQGFTYQQYVRLRDHNQAMDLAAYSRAPLNVAIDGRTEPTLEGQLVSGGYFPLLGLRAGRGRLFGPDDDRVPAGHPVAVISDAYWKTRFARDPEIVGRQISVSGVPFTIVGVTPPEFFGVEVGAAPRLFVPIMMQPVVMPATENLVIDRPNLYSTWLRVVGRVGTGVSPAQASARLEALAREADWRPRNKFTGQPAAPVRLVLTSAATGLSDLRRQFSQPLFILAGIVGIMLLIACANTGNLVLARSAARRPEFALRLALGAGRSRLIRQVLAEGLVLAALGGACGVALTFWATQALVAYASAGRSPIALDLTPDLRVLAFTAVMSALAGVLFGSVPAIRASRADTTSRGRGDLAAARPALGRGPGRTLVVSQVALSLVLLVGAGLFIRSLQNLNRHDTEVDQARVLVVRVEPRGSGSRRPGVTERLHQTYLELVERIERIPGVQSASLARTSPLTPISFSNRVALPSGGAPRVVPDLMIYPRYFATMGIPIVKGRDFTGEDMRPDSPPVVIVNEAFVRGLLGGREPLGVNHGVTASSRRPPGSAAADGPPPLNIIGVVKDSRYPSLRDAPQPTMYQTFLQANTGFGQMVLHVRVANRSIDPAAQVRAAVQAVDPDAPMFEVQTLADEVDATLVRERLVATLSAFFGTVALLLIGIGLYGLMAFTVSRRTAEIGIRVALGATPFAVRWMIARHALTVVLTGIAIGVPAAWITGRLAAIQLAGILFELRPWDPATMAVSTAVLVLAGLAAGLLPAVRAARIDPIVALRSE